MRFLNDNHSEIEQRSLLCERLDMYIQEKGGFSNSESVRDYLIYILHFVIEKTDHDDYLDDFIMLAVKHHYDIDNVTAIALAADDARKEFPEDELFARGPGIMRSMTDADMEEIVDFLDWDIRNERWQSHEKACRYTGILWSSRNTRYDDRKKEKNRMRKSCLEEKRMEYSAGLFRAECRAFMDTYTPSVINEYLGCFVIGQEEARRCVSLAVYNHYLRICHPEEKLVKSNVLLIGPTGCGKTEIIRKLKELLNVPVVIADFSRVVGSAWKGRHKEDALSELLLQAKDKVQAERGIVFIDEFDKLASIDEKRGHQVMDEVQGQMLGMLEGTLIEVPDPKDTERKITLNTENILFICAGAFEGLEKVAAEESCTRENGFGMIRHGKQETLTNKNMKEEYLIKYGFKAELIGRFAEICVLNRLSTEDLKRIFFEPEDSIYKRYCNLFELGCGRKPEFTDEAVEKLIDRAEKRKTGARGINSILNEVMGRKLYEAFESEGEEIVITKEDIEEDC